MSPHNVTKMRLLSFKVLKWKTYQIRQILIGRYAENWDFYLCVLFDFCSVCVIITATIMHQRVTIWKLYAKKKSQLDYSSIIYCVCKIGAASSEDFLWITKEKKWRKSWNTVCRRIYFGRRWSKIIGKYGPVYDVWMFSNKWKTNHY